jgi:hypothetical protein
MFPAIMVLTNSKILQFDFPGIQSYMFDKIDSLPLYQLMQPRKLFYECLNAGLMPEGAYVSGKPYSKVIQAVHNWCNLILIQTFNFRLTYWKPFMKWRSTTIWQGFCADAPLISLTENMKVPVSQPNISLSGLGIKLWTSRQNLMNCVSTSSSFISLDASDNADRKFHFLFIKSVWRDKSQRSLQTISITLNKNKIGYW